MLNFKIILFLSCLILSACAASKIVGQAEELQGSDREKAIQLLRDDLVKLAAGDGPSYQAREVSSVTGQVVSGYLYKYKVDLENKDNVTKPCDVSIWSQPWLEKGDKITIKCPGDQDVQGSV